MIKSIIVRLEGQELGADGRMILRGTLKRSGTKWKLYSTARDTGLKTIIW